MNDIIDSLLDLQKQATLEKSHYYVANMVTLAIQEIVSLRNDNENLINELEMIKEQNIEEK